MKLFCRTLGTGKPLVILHGLYGSGENWYTIGKALSPFYTVYLVDQRNHGNSPHHPDHDYDLMREDLYELFIERDIRSAVLVGHSMGGKTAMSFALHYPGLADRMVIVDISPGSYHHAVHNQTVAVHTRIIRALQALNPGAVSSREQADELLEPDFPREDVRQFLLKSLRRSREGGYYWQFNLDALAKHMDDIASAIYPEDIRLAVPYKRPVLFLKGEYSDYIRPEDEKMIRYLFPLSVISVIPDAGHWMHAEQPAAFLKALSEFLELPEYLPGLPASL